MTATVTAGLHGTWSPAGWIDTGSQQGSCPPGDGHAEFTI